MKYLRLVSIFVVIHLLVGCKPLDNKNSNDVENQNSDIMITTEPGLGTVKGTFLDSNTRKPYQASLFLSKNLMADHPDYPPLISFSYQTNPRAAQDNYGNFVFSNVEPGEYVIVIYKPSGQNFFPNSETNQPEKIIVLPDKIFDMGKIYYP
jgi:hypothetical protein